MITTETMAAISAKYRALVSEMDERTRRVWAASEARTLGRGGVAAVARATGIARSTIRAGARELAGAEAQEVRGQRRVRRAGGGRKSLVDRTPALMVDLQRLVESTTRGDPMTPLRWTCKSTRNLADELTTLGYRVSDRTVADLLHRLDYSLQSNRKTREGTSHPDRNAQFEYINATVAAFQDRGCPVISVDTKKKELVGDFRNGGREWRPIGKPEEVRTHDFLDKTLGKAIPYGVYDVGANAGWVSVGVDHDTAEFAVETIRKWWLEMGSAAYPNATELLITADNGGSNGSRVRLWKVAVQRLADETGLRITVLHLPPGTSKWNKIEHRLFNHITKNWRGRPLVSLDVIVNLIGHTTTRKGLSVRAELDTREYPKGVKVTEEELAKVHIARHEFHGDWNYTIVASEPKRLEANIA